jgi:hypothetical protein
MDMHQIDPLAVPVNDLFGKGLYYLWGQGRPFLYPSPDGKGFSVLVFTSKEAAEKWRKITVNGKKYPIRFVPLEKLSHQLRQWASKWDYLNFPQIRDQAVLHQLVDIRVALKMFLEIENKDVAGDGQHRHGSE